MGILLIDNIMEFRIDKTHWSNDKMTEDVVISMRGLQFEQGDIDTEQVETITIGKYSVEEKTGCHHIEFDEILEGFDGSLRSILRFGPGFLELTRTGFINVHMVFQEKRKNLTNYATPYGEILIGIDAKKIHITQKPDKITVNVEYALEVNYEYLSDCRIVIHVSSKDRGDSLLS